jgi:hypothetical protein
VASRWRRQVVPCLSLGSISRRLSSASSPTPTPPTETTEPRGSSPPRQSSSASKSEAECSILSYRKVRALNVTATKSSRSSLTDPCLCTPSAPAVCPPGRPLACNDSSAEMFGIGELPPGSTPIPWHQLGVLMAVRLSEPVCVVRRGSAPHANGRARCLPHRRAPAASLTRTSTSSIAPGCRNYALIFPFINQQIVRDMFLCSRAVRI